MCQIAAVSASKRCRTRAMTPGLVRPPCRSRSSWVLRVLLTDSMIWRNGRRNRRPARGFSDLVAGRIRVIPASLRRDRLPEGTRTRPERGQHHDPRRHRPRLFRRPGPLSNSRSGVRRRVRNRVREARATRLVEPGASRVIPASHSCAQVKYDVTRGNSHEVAPCGIPRTSRRVLNNDDCSGLPPADPGIMPAIGRPLVDWSVPSK